jgi:hypothetical protein
MTKKFCDRCSEEIHNKIGMDISYSGKIYEDLIYRNVSFCKECFLKIENVIEKFLPLKTKALG